MSLRAKLIMPVFTLCACLAVTATSCGGGGTVEGAKWMLQSYAVDGELQSMIPASEVDATFADGTVSGTGGCNQYSGSYELDGEALSIGPLVSTMMACDQAIMDQEVAFMSALGAAASYEVSGDTLTVKDEAGTISVVFDRVED